MRSEAIPAQHEPETLALVLGTVVGAHADGRLQDSRRLSDVWLASNGDAERRHTVRVWLRPSPRQGLAPILVVEVDSHATIADFNAKRDLYMGRLAHYDQQVSRIEFRYAPMGDLLSKLRATNDGASVPARELDDAERERIGKLASIVPESLRGVVSRALAASLAYGRGSKEDDDT